MPSDCERRQVEVMLQAAAAGLGVQDNDRARELAQNGLSVALELHAGRLEGMLGPLTEGISACAAARDFRSRTPAVVLCPSVKVLKGIP
jgi:hypothetical protein